MSDSTASGHDPANRSPESDRPRADLGGIGSHTAHHHMPAPSGAAHVTAPGTAHTCAPGTAHTATLGAAHAASLSAAHADSLSAAHADSLGAGRTGRLGAARSTTVGGAFTVPGDAPVSTRGDERTGLPGRVVTIGDVRFAVVRSVPAPRPVRGVRPISGVGVGQRAEAGGVSAGRRTGFAAAAW